MPSLDDFDAFFDDATVDWDEVDKLVESAQRLNESRPPAVVLPQAVGHQPDSASQDEGDSGLDEEFLAQITQLERNALHSTEVSNSAVGHSLAGPSHTSSAALHAPSHLLQSSDMKPCEAAPSVPSRKRTHSSESLQTQPKKKKNKGRADLRPDVQEVLKGFDEDLTCPICFDFLVACHMSNPCGHSACGSCSHQWLSNKKTRPTCFACRAALDKNAPFIPAFAMDNLIEKHVHALGANGDDDWSLSGVKRVEWEERRRCWTKEHARIKATESKRIALEPLFRVVTEDEEEEDDDDDDDDEEEEEEEEVEDGLDEHELASLRALAARPVPGRNIARRLPPVPDNPNDPDFAPSSSIAPADDWSLQPNRRGARIAYGRIPGQIMHPERSR